MYTEYYALTGRPFQLSPSPAFFYASRAHRRAVAYFTFGLQQGEGFIVITGEVGTGKTTLVGYLQEQLSDQRLFVARISALSLRADDVLKLVARALALDPTAASKASMLGLIERDLRERHAQRQRVLLIVDEAQNLARSALETLRALSNLEQEGRALIQVLLVGQPQFRDTLAASALEQLRQRVVASAHLGALEADEVRPYLEHRLRRVGWSGKPAFEPAIFGEIYAFSRGLPRRINLLAARLLVHGAIDRRATLTAEDARELARELEREHALPDEAAPPQPTATDLAPARAGGGGAGPGQERHHQPAPPQRPEEREFFRREVERLRRKLENAYDDLSRERTRSDGAREEAERLRGELHRIEVERLRVDAETTRRLAEVLGETGAGNGHRRGGGLLRRLI